MDTSVMRFRARGELKERILAYHRLRGGDLADVLRELVEKALDYGDTETYNLAKSVSQLSGSYDSVAERLATIEHEVLRMSEEHPDLVRGVAAIGSLVMKLEARQPTIVKSLGELILLGRLVGGELGDAKMKKVGEGIDRLYEMLMARIAEDAEKLALTTPALTTTEPRS